MTNGSRSSFPLTRLAAKYNQMISDGRVLSNRAAIDVIDERIKQLLGRIDVDEAPERVAKLYNLWKEYREHREHKRELDAVTTAARIDEEFEKVYHDYQAWNQMFTALDLRGRAVEREVKILRDIRSMMTAEDAYQLIAKLLGSVMKVIGDDPGKLKQVQYEFARIIGESSDRTAEEAAGNDWGGSGQGGWEEGLRGLDQEKLLHPGDEE